MFSRGELSLEESSESIYVCTRQHFSSLCDKTSTEYMKEI